jgi:hypothetical protein
MSPDHPSDAFGAEPGHPTRPTMLDSITDDSLEDELLGVDQDAEDLNSRGWPRMPWEPLL